MGNPPNQETARNGGQINASATESARSLPAGVSKNLSSDLRIRPRSRNSRTFHCLYPSTREMGTPPRVRNESAILSPRFISGVSVSFEATMDRPANRVVRIRPGIADILPTLQLDG